MPHHIPRAAVANECLWHPKCSGPRSDMRSATRAARGNVHRVVTHCSAGPKSRMAACANSRLQRGLPTARACRPVEGIALCARRGCPHDARSCGQRGLSRRSMPRCGVHPSSATAHDLHCSGCGNCVRRTAHCLTEYHDQYLMHCQCIGCGHCHGARLDSRTLWHCCGHRHTSTAPRVMRDATEYGEHWCEHCPVRHERWTSARVVLHTWKRTPNAIDGHTDLHRALTVCAPTHVHTEGSGASTVLCDMSAGLQPESCYIPGSAHPMQLTGTLTYTVR